MNFVSILLYKNKNVIDKGYAIGTIKEECYNLSSEKMSRKSLHLIKDCWKLSLGANITFHAFGINFGNSFA